MGKYIDVIASCDDRNYVRIDIAETALAREKVIGIRQIDIKERNESKTIANSNATQALWLYTYFDATPILVPQSYTIEWRVFNSQQKVIAFEVFETQSLFFDNSIYMIDDEASLRIAYNPNITGYKYNTQDNIVQPLGSQYPIIRRNGAMKYCTFNLNGLLSYQSELTEIPEFYRNHASIYKQTNREPEVYLNHQLCRDTSLLKKIALITTNSFENPYWLHEAIEQEFKKVAIDFLMNGKPKKIISSMDSINNPVYLTNVSFTPEKQLGRLVYSFSATCTEVNVPISQPILTSGWVI